MENDLKREIITNDSLKSIKLVEKLLKQLQTDVISLNIMSRKEYTSEEKDTLCVKALKIAYFLENTLDHSQGGLVAENLQALYQFVRFAIVRFNDADDKSYIKSAEKVIDEINEGWIKVASNAA